jgi:hypothetical protein
MQKTNVQNNLVDICGLCSIIASNPQTFHYVLLLTPPVK